MGGRFGGYGLYLLKGKPVFVYNLLDLKRYRWEGGVGGADWLGNSLKPGKHTIVFDFKYDGPGFGKGGTGVLSVDGKELSRQKIEHTIPFLMAIDETFDVGDRHAHRRGRQLQAAVPLHRQDRQADLQARARAADGRGAAHDAEGARQGARLADQCGPGPAAPVSEAGRNLLRKVLVFAAVVEIGTGVAFMVDPAIVVTLLLGVDVARRGDPTRPMFRHRACRARNRRAGRAGTPPQARRPALRAMLVYNALIAAFLAWLGIAAHMAGVLLWPAVALHAGVALVLVGIRLTARL